MEAEPQIEITQLLAELKKLPDQIAEERYEMGLDQLEAYECWEYWFRLVKSHAAKYPDSFVEDQCKIARVQIRYFDDVKAAADCCKAVVESSGMSFSQFRAKVLDRVLELEDFGAEGVILQTIWERFSTLEDRVEALERICFIYEKKVHNDKLLNQYHERLLKSHPQNAKALRYFRNLNTQMQDWPAVVEILRKLMTSAKHPQEGFRYAQELAAVYLYQLDDPQSAVGIIEGYCSNSTLDTSTIHYEAYYRMSNYEGCLRVLRGCLATVEDQATKAIIHYRIGSLYEKLTNLQLAFENYERTVRFDENFLEAIEGLISTGLKLKQWNTVKDWLSVLASRVSSQTLASQVRTGLSRLEEGLQVAAVSRT